MVVVAVVNMLLSLVGFLPGLHKKSPAANRRLGSAANQSRSESLNEVLQKG
jgi:hypothetical protein